MHTRPKRPISVWLAQGFVLFYGVWFVLFAFVMYRDLAEIEGYPAEETLRFAIAYTTMALAMGFVFISMSFRWRISRWLVVLLFSAVHTCFLYGFLFLSPRRVLSPFEALQDVLPFLLLAGPFAIFALIFAFNPSVIGFFRGEILKPIGNNTPPPPPTFDR